MSPLPEETVHFIGMPVATARYVVPGSERRICSECRAEVWMAPSSLTRIRETDVIMCVLCALPKCREADKNNDLEMVALPADALEELAPFGITDERAMDLLRKACQNP